MTDVEAALGPPRLVRLTPRGRGAVAVLRLTGAGAIEAVAPFFRRPDGVGSAAAGLEPPGRVRYGRWVRVADKADAPAEDVVLCQVAPNVVEIHCHGGEQAPAAIMDSLVGAGLAILAEPDDEIAASFPEAWRREAFHQLARATAPIAARILWDQFRGAWPRAIARWTSLARDDDAIATARAEIDRALQFAELGRRLADPWIVVLAGPPNVGKSSLVNRLVGYERAIAYDQPGTTRDVLAVRSVVAGLPVEFRDTAGLRESFDAIEREGITRTRGALAVANVVLLLADAASPWDVDLDELRRATPGALLIHHKRDLVAGIPADRPAGLAVSSLTGEGVDELLVAIERRIAPQLPRPGEFVPILESQVESLLRLRAASDAPMLLGVLDEITRSLE